MIHQSLARLRVFAHFPPAQLERLGRCAISGQYEEGTRLFDFGQHSHSPYVLCAGSVRLARRTAYGEVQLGTVAPSEIFGELSFVDRLPRSTDAVVAPGSRLLILDPDALDDTASGDRHFHLALYWTFWKSLSAKLRSRLSAMTRFFPEGGEVPTETLLPATAAAPDFRVELAAKRALFAEQKLSRLEINFLSSLSRELKLAPGQTIFREGDPGDNLYVVLDGRVLVTKFIPGGGQEALGVLQRGDYFGEMALIDELPRAADARAHDDEGAVLLAIPRDVMAGLLDIRRYSSVRLLSLLARLVSRRLRLIDDKLAGWFMMSGGDESPPLDEPAE